MDLAGKVRRRREELGWTQEELAKRMGYASRVSINKIETGRPVSQKIILRLAEAMDTDPAYLMGWDKEDKKEKPTEYDGLSEKKQALMQFAASVPDDKAEMILRVIKSIVEAD